jgi:phosphonate transport system substrate-binding protein
MIIHKFLKLISAVFLIALIYPITLNSNQEKTYTFAVLPQQPPANMYRLWTPVIEKLRSETGLNLKLKVYERMNDFEYDLSTGKNDFIYTNPTQMVLSKFSQGYIPLVRNNSTLRGIIFVRNDSKIQSIKDLNGKEIAFVGSKNL